MVRYVLSKILIVITWSSTYVLAYNIIYILYKYINIFKYSIKLIIAILSRRGSLELRAFFDIGEAGPAKS